MTKKGQHDPKGHPVDHDMFSDDGRFHFHGRTTGASNFYTTEIVLGERHYARAAEEKAVELLTDAEILEAADND